MADERKKVTLTGSSLLDAITGFGAGLGGRGADISKLLDQRAQALNEEAQMQQQALELQQQQQGQREFLVGQGINPNLVANLPADAIPEILKRLSTQQVLEPIRQQAFARGQEARKITAEERQQFALEKPDKQKERRVASYQKMHDTVYHSDMSYKQYHDQMRIRGAKDEKLIQSLWDDMRRQEPGFFDRHLRGKKPLRTTPMQQSGVEAPKVIFKVPPKN